MLKSRVITFDRLKEIVETLNDNVPIVVYRPISSNIHISIGVSMYEVTTFNVVVTTLLNDYNIKFTLKDLDGAN